MKLGMDIFCSSPASTAIRSDHSEEEDSNRSHITQLRRTHHQSYNSINSGGGITPKLMRVLSSPCSSSSKLALNPNPVSRHEYKQLQKQKIDRKSSSSFTCCGADDNDMLASYEHQMWRRRSSADASDHVKTSASTGDHRSVKHRLLDHQLPDSAGSYKQVSAVKLERSSRRPPRKSSGDENDSPKLKSSSGYHGSTDKIVVLWVALHCKGCEAKVRKHISKMEGVTSFSTDWVTKRVTIISKMDPYDVLSSVSKIKYAQFWPSSSTTNSHQYYSSSPSSSSSPSAPLLTLIR